MRWELLADPPQCCVPLPPLGPMSAGESMLHLRCQPHTAATGWLSPQPGEGTSPKDSLGSESGL